MSRSLKDAVRSAVEDGLPGAAIMDREGKVLAIAGALDVDEPRAFASLIVNHPDRADLVPRMFDGEVLEIALDGRDAGIGIAARSLFVVVLLRNGVRQLAEDLRDQVAQLVLASVGGGGSIAWGDDSGGSSGPADLPLVEYGLTVRRNRGKA